VREGCTTAGIGCTDCKQLLLKNMLPIIEPLHEKRVELEKKSDRVRELLVEGSSKAQGIARETMTQVRQAMKIEYKRLAL